MYVRYLESRGYAAATVARRFGTVATFYKYAVIDGVIAANPAAAVTRPKVAWEGQKRTVLHPLEFAAAARRSPNLRPERPRAGLPARHARAAGVGSMRDPHHRPALRGRLRAAARAGQGRQARRHPAAHPGAARGAGSRRRAHHRPDPADPHRAADGPRRRQPRPHPGRPAAGIAHPISPHGLRRTFCTTGLVAGISIRDMQYAMRHADPRTTMRSRAATWFIRPGPRRGSRRLQRGATPASPVASRRSSAGSRSTSHRVRGSTRRRCPPARHPTSTCRSSPCARARATRSSDRFAARASTRAARRSTPTRRSSTRGARSSSS